MREITVMGSPLILHFGIVKLTKKQADIRTLSLVPHTNDKGKPIPDCYKITREVCFKVGETIGYADGIANFRPETQKPNEKDVLIGEKDALIKKLMAKVEELEKALEVAKVKIEELEKALEVAKAKAEELEKASEVIKAKK